MQNDAAMPLESPSWRATLTSKPGSNSIEDADANGSETAGIPADQLHALESLREWIEVRTGMHFRDGKQTNLYRRLSHLCWRLGLANVKELELHMWANDIPSLASEIAYAVSTSHSFFYREPEVLDYLRDTIVPSLPRGEPLRIWSAAAASGEEAYSVAIMLSEKLGGISRNHFSILGTDISYPMVENAEKGIFPMQRLELVPKDVLQNYFRQVGTDQWQVVQPLADLCIFRRMNLKSHPWPFQNAFHVILCRNVLYYFDHARQEELIEHLYDAAMPHAWLLTSVTETLHNMSTRWRRVSAGIYRKVDEKAK